MRRRRNRWSLALVALEVALGPLLLTACKKQVAAPMFAAPVARGFATAAQSSDTIRHIAFSHAFILELPSNDVEATQQKNLTDCIAAGCNVLSTHIDRLRNGVVQAAISVRIAPDRYQAFATAITASPARLLSHTETATDQTAPLLDIEKRLAAQTVLRDRLSDMLKQAGSNVGDLVAVEKQLADVQGTIESETAQRDYLRTITDTVKVDVSYNGLIEEAGPFDISPVREAADNFARTVIASFGEMITWVAYALPWIPLLALAAWLASRLLRRRPR